MSCTAKRSNLLDKPKVTPAMKKKNQTYVWDSIKKNPNMYCWIPKSKKNIVISKLSFDDVNLQDIPPAPIPKNSDKLIEEIIESSEKMVNKVAKQKFNSGNDMISFDDPKKYKIVRQFIIDKNLVLYGGAAINMYMPAKDKFYKSNAIPDYDFYSTDPWNNAVELAERLYDAGYKYTEVRGGIHKGTYKVFSNLWAVADISYVPPSMFDKLKYTKKNGMKIASPAVLEIDMFKQLSEPSGNASRWLKVSNRQKLLQKWTKPLGKFKCSKDIFLKENEELDPDHTHLLEISSDYIKSNKLTHQGALAYNTFIEVGGGEKRLKVNFFNVLVTDSAYSVKELFDNIIGNKTFIQSFANLFKNPDDDLMKNKFKNRIKIITKYDLYKSNNTSSHSIYLDENEVCRFTQYTLCTPHKYILGNWVTSVDVLKTNLYTQAVFFDTKEEQNDVKCLINYLSNIQNNYYKIKTKTEFDNTPFQRYVINCKGPIDNQLKKVLFERWVDRVERNETIRTVKPKSDKITLKGVDNTVIKITPREDNIPPECKNKTKKDCKYPCAWDKETESCYGEPIGIFRVGEKGIQTHKGVEEYGADDVKGGAYPFYG
jgi:hypothetical protein